jgi:hypothetical protein
VLCDRADPDARAGVNVAGLHSSIFAREHQRVKSRALGRMSETAGAPVIPMRTAMLRDQKMTLPDAVGREGLFPPLPRDRLQRAAQL